MEIDELLDIRALSKMRWRCRRGLLENDLFIEKFFARYEADLRVSHERGMSVLMDLADNDLLDLLLRRTELDESVTDPEVKEVLVMLRSGSNALIANGPGAVRA